MTIKPEVEGFNNEGPNQSLNGAHSPTGGHLMKAEDRLALVEQYATTTDPIESKKLEDKLLQIYFG